MILSIDSSFIIPELFKEKFDIFNKLFKNNNLNYDSFISEYYNNTFYNDTFIINKSSEKSNSDTIAELNITTLSNSIEK